MPRTFPSRRSRAKSRQLKSHRAHVAAFLCVLALAACQRRDADEATPAASGASNRTLASSSPLAASPPTSSAHATPAATEPVLDAPIYDLELSLTDQENTAIGLDVFKDSPVVVSMFYATCPFACPTLISDIKRLEQKLDPKLRAKTRVLLVTFDPDRDTPDKLMELAKVHKVDTKRWKFARANKEDTRALANVLGLKYRQLASGQFNHSSVISVVDGKGLIRGRVEGLERPNEELLETLKTLASAE